MSALGLTVLAAVGIGVCVWDESRDKLDEGEFRGIVLRELALGSTEAQVVEFLQGFEARDRRDTANVGLLETRRADSPQWGCGPEPCAPMHFGAPPDALVVTFFVYNASGLFDWVCSGEQTTYFFIIDGERGFTELHSYARLDGCL